MWTCQVPGILKRPSDPMDTALGYRWERMQTQPAEQSASFRKQNPISCLFQTVTSIPNIEYLIFAWILQGTDERSMATHGVSADGHPVRISGEVSIDKFRELTKP